MGEGTPSLPKPVKNSFLKAFGNDRIDSDASITIWVQRITPFAFKDRGNQARVKGWRNSLQFNDGIEDSPQPYEDSRTTVFQVFSSEPINPPHSYHF